MKKIISIILIIVAVFTNIKNINIYGDVIDENELYSIGACLMDADSGRVLFGKNECEMLANASTTKIMTCILALEYGDLQDVVTISKYAASMPDVQLNAKEDDKFYLKDLLYSLMLESHNDSAVAIAEHIAGSVETFAEMMNNKAKDLGCYDTNFVTPNGLDAIDDKGNKHSTTAFDLCKIMAYCIQNEEFVNITQTKNYSFCNIDGNRSYSVNNKNAFLDMMEGVISGKTGFTNDAGYCYVAALERDGKKYVIALLGCGWPYNKNYKWKDSRTLFNYGINEYSLVTISNDTIELPNILVKNGKNKTGDLMEDTYISCYMNKLEFELLLKSNESVEYELDIKNVLEAEVKKGDIIGTLTYVIADEQVKVLNIYASETVEKVEFIWILETVIKKFFLW